MPNNNDSEKPSQEPRGKNLLRERRYFRKMRRSGLSPRKARIAAHRTASHVAELRQRFPAIDEILLVAICMPDHSLCGFTLHYDTSRLTCAEQNIAEAMTKQWAESSQEPSQ